MDLETATLDDIAGELKRRGLRFALVVDQLMSGPPVPDVPVPQRQRVLSNNPWGPDHPLKTVFLLCEGIQWESSRCSAATVALLSPRVQSIQTDVKKLLD